MSPRKLYRLWRDLELKIEKLAKERDTTPAKMLNIVLTEALKDVKLDALPKDTNEEEDEELPDIANHNAF